jgi:ankyrin repeat protein
MEYLFDANKPHFKVWLTLYDIDTQPDRSAALGSFPLSSKSPAAPLYYAALCGFHNLVKHLMAQYPQGVNAHGGYFISPLVAALAGKHIQTADLLLSNGADPHVRGFQGSTPLHSAVSYRGYPEAVQKLIEYDVDINAENMYGSTPLHWASRGHCFKSGTVLQLLLEHGADIKARNRIRGWTPLHEASCGAPEMVPLLLKHGADVKAEDNDGKTALQVAAAEGHDKVVELLREHGAK